MSIKNAKLREYEKAETTLKKAVERDSQNAYTYSVLSSVLVAQEKFDEAEDALKKAQKLAPSDSEVYLNYGILYAKQQKRTKAIEMLKKSKFLNPTNTHVYFLLGVMLFETDKTNEAFIEFKQLEEFNPNYKNLSYYLALCYKKEKNNMAVLEYAQRALEESPKNSAIYILLAQNYLSLNKPEECFKIFNLGLEKGIEDFDFYLAWGISLLNNNPFSARWGKTVRKRWIIVCIRSLFYPPLSANFRPHSSLFPRRVFCLSRTKRAYIPYATVRFAASP